LFSRAFGSHRKGDFLPDEEAAVSFTISLMRPVDGIGLSPTQAIVLKRTFSPNAVR
jgi:hypothetical protein